GHPDRQPLDIFPKGPAVIWHWRPAGGGVFWVRSGDDLEHGGCVFDGPRHRPAMIEGPAQRHHPIAADPTVGGFEPDDAAVVGRPWDRAAGARAERTHAQTGSHSGARAAAGAPWDMVEIPGIAGQGKAACGVGPP